MAQGKLKTKTKLPANVKAKQKKKGDAFTRRSNAPIKPKKTNFKEAQKIKQALTKIVNKTAEDEIRGLAGGSSNLNLSKAQEAVVRENKSKKTKDDTASTISEP